MKFNLATDNLSEHLGNIVTAKRVQETFVAACFDAVIVPLGANLDVKSVV
jgi:hypothetical protein